MNFRFPAAPLLACAMVALTCGCTVQVVPEPQRVYVRPTPNAVIETAPAPASVVSVYLEPPLSQPTPVLVPWAPPPMLVEAPPMMPFPGAVWIGGFWTWRGNWVWAAGRWAAPPQPNYVWVQPDYEHRDAAVVFVNAHWAAPGVVFVPPPPTLNISFVEIGRGVVPGPRPIGPMGVFVPPPPGSRHGIIVPAPIGTAPAVMMSAPAVMNVGMRVQTNTTINNVNNTRVTNLTNVTVVAPATATATGQAYQANVPALAHLAAALPAVAHAPAPSTAPVPASAVLPAHPAPVALPLPLRPVAQEESHHPASVGTSSSIVLPKPQEPVAPTKPAVVAAPAPSAPVPVAHTDAQPQGQRVVQPAHATPEKAGPEKSVPAAANAGKAAHEKAAHAESNEEKALRLKKEKEELERRAKG